MDKNLTIFDKDSQQWIDDLVERYKRCQISAAIHVNIELS